MTNFSLERHPFVLVFWTLAPRLGPHLTHHFPRPGLADGGGPRYNLLNMIAPPSSRRFRIFGALTVLTLIATYVHLRPRWNFEYREYYEDVTNYFSRPVYDNTLYNEGNDKLVQKHYNTSDPCARFPNTDGVLLVMKTGATEAFDRLPTQLLSTMSCLPESKFLLFSDLVN